MGTRFTRVTVVGDRHQIDISLPCDSPIAAQLPAVLRLLSVASSPVPVRWRLAAPEFGPLDPSRSLDDLGVLDGAVLYLVEAEQAPAPPFVDDVEGSIAETVAEQSPPFAAGARRSAMGMLIALLLLGAIGIGLVNPTPTAWLAPLLVVLAGAAAAQIPGRGGLLAALTIPLALGAAVYGFAAARPSLDLPDTLNGVRAAGLGPTGEHMIVISIGWVGFRLVLAAVLAVGLVLAGILRKVPGLTAGAAVVGVCALLALLCDRLGLPPERTAGLGLVVAVIGTGLAGQLALGGAGLVDLMVADEQGRPVARQAVRDAVGRGLGIATGVIAASVIVAGCAVWVLILGGAEAGWIAPAVGVLGGGVFLLRSRMFTRTTHVGLMLAVGVVAVVAVGVAAPEWIGVLASSVGAAGALSLGALVLFGLLMSVAGFATLSDVAGARVARLLDRLELLAVLALVPGVIVLFRVIPAVQRWLG